MPTNANQKIPHAHLYRFLGMTFENMADFIYQTTQRFGNVFKLPRMYLGYNVFNTQESVQHILLGNQQNFSKQDPYYNRIRSLLGEGLLTNDGESWRSQRQQLQPYFHSQKIIHYFDTIVEQTLAAMTKWRTYAIANKPMDIASEMLQLTMIITGKILFSTDLSQNSFEFTHAVALCNRQIGTIPPYQIPQWVPIPRNIRFKHAFNHVNQLIQDIIIQRRQDNENKHNDLLDYVLHATQANSAQPISEKLIADEVLTLLITGHETLGVHMAWTWLLLSKNPRARDLLHQELKHVLKGKLPNVNNLNDLVYTKAIVQESLRLYPPVWCNVRRTHEDDVIDGYFLPANSDILFCSYALHRNPQYWENAEAFLPERFLPENSKKNLKYCYLPFGGGPRICIASHFAITQAILLLATIAQHFDFNHDETHKIDIECLINMKSRNGIFAQPHLISPL